MSNKIKKALKSPGRLMLYLLKFKVFRILPDEVFLKIKYRLIMNKKLNLKSPKTYNEKLQWLKIHNRDPKYTMMVDKYAVRKHVAETIGEEHLIPLLGVWNKVEDIDFDKLPNQFVLKPNHTSGNVFICKDKSKVDFDELRKTLNDWLQREYYWVHREWPYKDVEPKIICEELIKTDDGGAPIDYKFHCFNGEPDNVMACIGRETGDTKFYFFDKGWNLLRYNVAGINAPEDFSLPKPEKLDEMFAIADKLAADMPFVRVDLYTEGEKIYFGELTFFPQSGFEVNLMEKTDLLFGEKIDLNSVGK